MIRRKRTETRWVIVYDQGPYFQGLYTGQWLTRKAAIQAHCEDKGGYPCCANAEQIGHPGAFRGPVGDAEIAVAWRHWRKQGDRAVKATITWEEPAK